MKILFVHQHLGALGGAEANIFLTARELGSRSHSVALLHGPPTGRSEEKWRQVFSHTYQLDDESNQECIDQVLNDFRPDLIYVHNFGNLEALKHLLEAGLPVVRMVHDHEMYCLRGYKYNVFTREICRRPASFYCVWPCLATVARNRSSEGLPIKMASYGKKRKEIQLNRRCDRFVVYSEYTREELVRNGFDGDKVEVHVPIRCWGTDGPVSNLSDRNLILYAGQIIRGKGVDILLKALAKVQVPFECIILGDGGHRAKCEKLATQLGLGDRVQFRGFVLREELKNFYLQSSVFVVSSVWPEPFGMTGPEAMRYGLPVVAFDAGGIREWLIDGENGFLVPWMDTDYFAACVEKLLIDKDLGRRMGRKGMERVNREYDSNCQVDQLEQMFRKVVGAPTFSDAKTNFNSAFANEL